MNQLQTFGGSNAAISLYKMVCDTEGAVSIVAKLLQKYNVLFFAAFSIKNEKTSIQLLNIINESLKKEIKNNPHIKQEWRSFVYNVANVKFKAYLRGKQFDIALKKAQKQNQKNIKNLLSRSGK